jgi:hypothetical protein
MSSPLLDRLAVDLRDPKTAGGRNYPIGAFDLQLRYGKVVYWSQYSGLVDIVLADEGLILYDVERSSNYTPTVGDDVWVLQAGPDLIVLDRTGNFGPSAFAGFGWGYGGADLKVGNLSQTNAALNDPTGFAIEFIASPPQVLAGTGPINIITGTPLDPVVVGQSGMVMIGVSAYIQPTADADGTITSGTGICSVRIAPTNGAYLITGHPTLGVTYTGPVGTGATVSAVHLGGGLDPGPHSFTLVQANIGSYVAYAHRWIWVLPL